MNTKNRLIEKLLKLAKKHKVLTYPVLALVAVLSVFSYFFSWSKGAGKRVVAIILVMIMVVSQSYFLTSSATALVDDENAALVQQELQMASENENTSTEATTEMVTNNSDETTTEVTSTQLQEDSVNDTVGEPVTEAEVAGEDSTEATTEVSNMNLEEEDMDSKLANETVACLFYYGTTGSATYVSRSNITVNSETSNSYNASAACSSVNATLQTSAYTLNGCYTFGTQWYYDSGFTRAVTDTSSVTSNASEEGNPIVKLYCKQELVRYRVSIIEKSDSNAATGISYTTSPAKADTYWYVPVTDSLTISNIVRTGYTFNDVTIAGGGTSVDGEGTSTISFSGDTLDKTITINWNAQRYNIKYASNETTENITSQEVTYDGTDTFLAATGIADDKTGYTFSGWKIGDSSTVVNSGNGIAAYQASLFGQEVVLHPVYTYNNIEATAEAITYQYNVSASATIIQGKYVGASTSGGSNFTYEILDGGASTLAAKGITAEVTSSGVSVRTDGPTGTTGSTPIDLKIKITDSNAPIGTQPQTFTIHIYVEQCVVTINPITNNANKKAYDGTTDAYIRSPLATNQSGVTVSFNGCAYNSANVAEANRIILSGVSLNVPTGEDASNYVLQVGEGSDYTVEGSISKRNVYLKTYAVLPQGKTYIRAGEANPTFNVEEDTSESNLQTGFLSGDTVEDLGQINFSTNRPTDLAAAGTYTISATAATDSNYNVKIDSEDRGTFEVVKETPTLNTNYEVTGTLGNQSWYKTNPAQIKPKGDYNTVRVSTDGQSVTDSGSIVSISEENYPKGTTVYVQLFDSATNAVTSWQSISVKVDETAPEYIGYTLTQDTNTLYESTPVEGALYFPTKGMVTFGNYYNRMVRVTVRYKDITSNPAILHYGLYGAGSSSKTALFSSADTQGVATASFEIYKDSVDKVGIINYYAEDNAGNKGNEYILQRDGTTEWSVETTGPSIDSFAIKTGENHLENVVSGSTNYYSNCKAVLSVSDETSGIYSVDWNVNGVSYGEERVTNSNAKQATWEFNKDINQDNFPSASGDYSVYAVITDNAQNTVTTDTITFKVDDVEPVINITSDYDSWQPIVKLEFNTYDELSGVKYINVTDESGQIIEHHVDAVNSGNGTSYCYFEKDTKGTYYIEVSDKAGNVAKKTINLTKVSNQIPDCPQITFNPASPSGNASWYTEIPFATISNITKTEDNTPVTTYYQLWKEGETAYNETSLEDRGSSVKVDMPGDGLYNLKVWSESVTGLTCEGTHTYQIKVDTKAPTIEYSTSKGSDSSVMVNFTVKDSDSGIDRNTIKVLHGNQEVVAQIEEAEGGYAGSFEISQTGNYTIQVADIAGNVADEAAFTPMSMKVKAVTNITANAATIGANVIKGTFDISSAVLSYRKYTDEEYTEVETLAQTDTNGNVNVSAVLDELEESTAYVFKVVATSAGEEVLEYEGYFKTLSSTEQGISVTGTARYANDTTGNITVGIYEGNVCSRAVEIAAGEEFSFANVPDGNYTISATDGNYVKSMRLLIQDGLVVYPENYIELILSGKNTSVVLTTSDTPNVTADNLDSIFDDDPINFTQADNSLIEAGGTVEFKLYATLMSVGEVSANEISAMYAVTDSQKVVGAYLDLSLYKIVTDSKGEVERKRVTELSSGANVSVTIPLGDLAGKSGLEVVRIHNTGDSYLGASLSDNDSNPNTYTVSTNQFSTYAVLYSKEIEPTTTEKPTTEEIKDGTTDPSESGTINTTTEASDVDADDKDDNDNKKKPSKDKTTSSASVGSLTSSGSAKTGDMTPITLLGFVMVSAFGGCFFIRRKLK